ncbi:MAG TPA: FUSC family protein, partial [Rhodanobacteraceae bacterium]|nr:FUSC family protein [Rhodanobacteraceae bacterium]
LGSALALLAYFAWPTWERGRERATVAGLLDAYADYLDAVLHGDAQARHATRIEARAARSSAQASLDRLRAEPASRANLPRAEALVAQANRVVRAVMMLEAARGEDVVPANPQHGAFAQACDAALRDGAAALRESRAPQGDQALRARQRALAASLESRDATASAWNAALLDASDRIVDAIDSLLHVLAQPRDATP